MSSKSRINFRTKLKFKHNPKHDSNSSTKLGAASWKGLNIQEKLVVLVALSLPLERIPTVEFFGITLKLSLVFGSVLILLSLKEVFFAANQNFLMRFWFKIQAPAPKYYCLIVVFLIYAALSLSWSINLADWLRAYLSLGFVILLMSSVYLTLRQASTRTLDFVVKAILVASCVVILFGFWQWIADLAGLSASWTMIRPEYTAARLGIPRMQSTFLEPLFFGLFLLLPLSLLLADQKGRIVGSFWLRSIAVLLVELAIILSLARGAIAASFLIGLIGIWQNRKVAWRELKSLSLKKILVGLLLLILSLVFAAVALNKFAKKGNDEDHNYKRGVSTIIEHLKTTRLQGSKTDAAEQNSLSTRDLGRREALSLIRRNPQTMLFGVGAGQYGAALGQEGSATSNFMFLDLWAEYGLLGLSLIAGFLGLGLVTLIKFRKSSFIAGGVALFLTGFLVQSISFGEPTINSVWFALGLGLAACRAPRP